MNELLKQILDQLKSDPAKAIADIRKQTKDTSNIEKYIGEYRDFDRNQRTSQVDQIQKDKTVSGNNISRMVKIYINHAQNIVETLATFTIGKAVTLTPSADNNLSELIKQIWRINRMDAKLLDATVKKMSETQVAMNFFINNTGESSVLNKILVNLKLKAQAKEIKVKVLDNASGVMTPYFDSSGDMILFMWQFSTVQGSKTVNHTQIWDDTNLYYYSDATGDVALVPERSMPHGFDKIPIVYDSQFEPEWYKVKNPVDRHEVAMSKLGDANDYSGHPILVTEGKVNNMPLKEESGKHFNIPVKKAKDGTIIKGDVRFLESEMAPESNKLEIDKLEDIIAYGSGVPNLSLEKLKSLGNVAEKTVKLMFLGTELKAELKRNATRTFIERCINILISGITKTTNTSLTNDSKMLYYDIHFNSILPSDVGEKVTMVTKAVTSGVMSKETAVGIIDLVDNVQDELTKIDFDKTGPETDPNSEEKETEE